MLNHRLHSLHVNESGRQAGWLACALAASMLIELMPIEGESRSWSMLLDVNQNSCFLLSQTHRSI